MGYLVFSSVEVRAYGLVLMLGPLALWLTLRWMAQPNNWRRTGLLVIVLALAFYSSFTSIVYIAYLSFIVLFIHPRLLLRWVVVGIATVIVTLPAAIQFAQNASERLNRAPPPPLPFGAEMVNIYGQYGGTTFTAAILGLALLLVLYLIVRRRINWRWGLLLVVWAIVPVIIYVVKPNREYLNVRYVWWVVLGLVVLIGAATLYLPRVMQWGVMALLVGIAFIPVDWFQFRVGATEAAPMRMVLSWFAEHIRPGDVIIKDPYCVCGENIAWDYFLPQFFPQGELPWVTEPGNHSRVWYLATTGWKQDEKLKAAIMDGRKESIFVGPWNFLLRLYEGPPLWQGVAFGDQIALNGVEIPDNRMTFRENETIPVKLWWSALKQPAMDYSISLAVFDENGALVTQDDGPAHAEGTPEQMTAWKPGTYYEDYRNLTLPIGTPGRSYTIVVTVYDWQTVKRLTPAANSIFPLSGINSGYLLLRRFNVESY
jgi:hypothetical protein